MLGYLAEDAAGIDLTAHADLVPGISALDDSLFLGLLAANDHLDGAEPVDPQAEMSKDDFERLTSGAFGSAAASQQGADALSTAEGVGNLLVSGDGIALSAIAADRVAVARSEGLTLSGAKASALSILGAASVSLHATELDRAVVEPTVAGVEARPNVYLHFDEDSAVPEIIIGDAGEVIVEGNGALGIVRVLGDVGSLTIRATCSVSNGTQREIAVAGPDGQAIAVAPGGQAEFALTHYVVSFVTDGTPVPSQLLSPGETIDFGAISTAKDGYEFTAWYEDAAFTKPRSTFAAADIHFSIDRSPVWHEEKNVAVYMSSLKMEGEWDGEGVSIATSFDKTHMSYHAYTDREDIACVEKDKLAGAWITKDELNRLKMDGQLESWSALISDLGKEDA